MASSSFGLRKHLACLKDPRINRRKRHLLGDIITMAICAVIGGADTWKDIATFARRRQDWFQRFLALPNGIPSHHTFRRVFNRLDPLALQHQLVLWLHGLSDTLGIRHIAIDGKTLRHSGGGSSAFRQLHLVSAWATEAQLTLGQVATEEKSNEITAIPELLALLDLKGALVTLDAMGCQKEIAKEIIARKGDYVLTVKDNQEHLKEDIQTCFEKAHENDCQGVDYAWTMTEEQGHGRKEIRIYEVIYGPEGLRHQEAWPELKVIGRCFSERTVKGKTTIEERCFIGSKRCSVKGYGKVLLAV